MDIMENIRFSDSCNKAYMNELVTRDYMYYFKASDDIKKDYVFCMNAIYSCLSKVNNLGNLRIAVVEMQKFLNHIKKYSNIDMMVVISNKDNTIMVRERPKVKKLKFPFAA